MHFFGVVQYIGRDRTDDWSEFYGRLFGFQRLPSGTQFGILPAGTLLKSPGDASSHFYLQLIEPDFATIAYDEEERFQRIGLGTRDVPAAVSHLRGQGVEFVETEHTRVTAQGAVTRNVLHTVSFELVHDERP